MGLRRGGLGGWFIFMIVRGREEVRRVFRGEGEGGREG